MNRLETAITAVLLAAVWSAGCGRQTTNRPAMACTTSMLAAVVRQVAGPEAEVVVIVPEGMCPGHFDVKPGDIAAVSNANLLLYHGWEQWLDGLLTAVDRPDLIMEKAALAGTWMVPENHIRGVGVVRDILTGRNPGHAAAYTASAEAYIRSIRETAEQLRTLLIPLPGTRVLCSTMQKELVEWAGGKVVQDYGRSEDLAPQTLEGLIRRGKAEKVRLVVDNLQSGAKTGLRIAEETGAKHVVLTNFPVDGSYLTALEHNVRALAEAVTTP